MKNVLFAFSCLAVILLCSCGGDDCVQEDWFGTYVLDTDSETCQDSTFSLITPIVIAAGSSTNHIDYDGTDLEINNCGVESTVLGLPFTIDLDGDQLTVEGLGCQGTYTRQ